MFNKKVGKILLGGGVAVIPTDTIYGLVGAAGQRETVERIYRLRHRAPNKPCVILISAIADLEQFGVKLDAEEFATLATREIWPGPVSVILPVTNNGLEYLTRGGNSLAFRLPALATLRELVAQTGPLIAPSANPEGKAPARTVAEAMAYFGDRVDCYIDNGELAGPPSTLIKLVAGRPVVVRSGALVL